MAKNIVVCCDGTGNEIERNLSNVLKLFRILRKNPEQRVYYNPGIGTSALVIPGPACARTSNLFSSSRPATGSITTSSARTHSYVGTMGRTMRFSFLDSAEALTR